MKKRLVALLMAMAMCFAMFGCGSSDAEEEAPAEDFDYSDFEVEDGQES